MSYFDDVCGDLRLARRVDGQWVVELVDEGDDLVQSEIDRVGRFSSLAQDVSGNLRISYFDETRGQLKLAVEQDGRFGIEVVDDGIDIDSRSRTRKVIVGAFSNIVVTNDGTQNIAYYDATNQTLKLARRTTNDIEWSIDTLDSNNIAGMNARLVPRGPQNILSFQRLIPDTDSLRSELVWREVAP